jgi:UDP-perosamine 4-acetyltransferase
VKRKLILYGAGGHGKVVADLVEKLGAFKVAGFLDDSRTGEFYGYPVLGRGEDAALLVKKGVKLAIATVGNCLHRKRLHEALSRAGFELAVAVHPSAVVARGAVLGPGTVIMPGTVVGPDVRIGQGCVVNTGAVIDHDCVLDDFVHVGPGASLSGEVRVGEGTLLGTGSSVRQGVSIGCWSMIGVGAAVVSDMPDRVVAVGVPAKVVGPCKDWSPK